MNLQTTCVTDLHYEIPMKFILRDKKFGQTRYAKDAHKIYTHPKMLFCSINRHSLYKTKPECIIIKQNYFKSFKMSSVIVSVLYQE